MKIERERKRGGLFTCSFLNSPSVCTAAKVPSKAFAPH